MNTIKIFLYSLPILIFVVVVTKRDLSKNELGSVSNPVKLFFTPSVDAQSITSNAKKLTDFLEKETGYYFTTAVPTSYIAVVEALGSNRCDIAAINTFNYLLAYEKYKAKALLKVIRDNNEQTYRGEFVAKAGSGIEKIEDLQGKKIAYVDPSSISGYILPKALLEKKNIKEGEIVFGMKHDNVITMVYQNQVDAGAAFYCRPDPKTGRFLDARVRVVKQFPDVGEKVKIIALTEEIPNDPVIFRAGLPDEMVDKIVDGILKFVSTEEGAKAMYEIYYVTGFARTKDSDYDPVRKMLKDLNINLSEAAK